MRSTSHPLNSTQAALRWLAGAKHVGKVVVMQGRGGAGLVASQQLGACLVTGGLGALGSVVAQWAAQHRTPELMLAGRSGHFKVSPSTADEAPSALAQMQGRFSGVVMHALRCDAGASEELASALGAGPSAVPVSQVMHAGGLLSDMLLAIICINFKAAPKQVTTR